MTSFIYKLNLVQIVLPDIWACFFSKIAAVAILEFEKWCISVFGYINTLTVVTLI